MQRVVQVRLREKGRIHSFRMGAFPFEIGDTCIVTHDRGDEYGQILSEAEETPGGGAEESLGKVKRVATTEDLRRIWENREKAVEALEKCLVKIEEFGLPMKLVDAEYSFDQSRIVFYFSAEGRVDFRTLVRDLASMFHARIELRQIGVRDEARMLGGLGCCGRIVCCATFLTDFESINIRMAKEQRLTLNPQKISGLCGRLLCCLRYEHEIYREALKRMPKEGSWVSTPRGRGKVVDLSVMRNAVKVRLEDDRQFEFPMHELTAEKR